MREIWPEIYISEIRGFKWYQMVLLSTYIDTCTCTLAHLCPCHDHEHWNHWLSTTGWLIQNRTCLFSYTTNGPLVQLVHIALQDTSRDSTSSIHTSLWPQIVIPESCLFVCDIITWPLFAGINFRADCADRRSLGGKSSSLMLYTSPYEVTPI